MDTHTDNNYEQIREIPRLDSALCNGSICLGYIALNRGEQINALWIVVASVCIYLIAYRFYGLYIAKNVLAVDPTRMTPAVRHNDGLDYVPTDKKCCSVTILRPLPEQVRWLGRYWRRKWVTCQG